MNNLKVEKIKLKTLNCMGEIKDRFPIYTLITSATTIGLLLADDAFASLGLLTLAMGIPTSVLVDKIRHDNKLNSYNTSSTRFSFGGSDAKIKNLEMRKKRQNKIDTIEEMLK